MSGGICPVGICPVGICPDTKFALDIQEGPYCLCILDRISHDFTLSANRNLMTPLCSNDELFASLVVISIYHHTYSNLKINKFCCK